jgi:glycosyltransferase involved in cell wall biosynthesis
VSQAEVLDYLREADMVVQPSECEEFGHAIAEAMACGVPVVVGPTNGTREYAPPAGSVVIDHYEPASLADALERGLAIARGPVARAACRSAASAFAGDRVAAIVSAFIRETQA